MDPLTKAMGMAETIARNIKRQEGARPPLYLQLDVAQDEAARAILRLAAVIQQLEADAKPL